MMRMSNQRESTYYDQRIEAIDDEICRLIQQRKEISNNNPGFPTKQLIADWSKKYHLLEEFLNVVFTDFQHEDIYRPMVEPKGFIQNIPILKSFEREDEFYTVTFIRQFKNASVVHLNVDKNITNEMDWHKEEHTYFELAVEGGETQHDCRQNGGGGTMNHEAFSFIVSPALPDGPSKFKLVFTEYKIPFNQPTGFEFRI